jgi:hypothetical protein
MLTMTLRITDCLEINDLQLHVIHTSEEISRVVAIFLLPVLYGVYQDEA